jgi:hypothetical protein
MDDFFTLIIIVITIISAIGQIVKAKQKSTSSAKPSTRSELGAKLKVFFKEIQQKLEEQSPKGSSGGDSPWDALEDAGQSEEPAMRSYELSLEDLELEEEKESAPPEKKPPAQPARVKPGPAERPVDSASGPCAPEPLVGKAAPCPEFLRRAVVWSEILRPPLALRDTPWDR